MKLFKADNAKNPESDENIDRIKSMFRKDDCLNHLGSVLTNYRFKGVNTFYQNKGAGFLEYNKEDARLSRIVINNHKGLAPIPKIYNYLYDSCGMYMCYFIGLAYMLGKDAKRFSEMRAYINKTDFTFFGNNVGSILSRKVNIVYLQNLPSGLVDSICRTTIRWRHLNFIKEYQRACDMLRIPDDQVIVPFSEYMRMKKMAYDNWLQQAKTSRETVKEEKYQFTL